MHQQILSSRGRGGIARIASTGAVVALLASLAVAPTVGAASMTVTTPLDENGEGTACSLREAITATNTNTAFGGCPAGVAGADTVVLPAGTYVLSGTAGEDDNGTGDLDIKEALTVRGARAVRTIVDGGGLDRVFDAHGTTLRLQDLTVRNGNPGAAYGGGVQVLDGTLEVARSVISGNGVLSGGGAVHAYASTLAISRSEISGNSATDARCLGGGGGILVSGPSTTITDSTISGNRVLNGSGGGVMASGTISILRSTISANYASDGPSPSDPTVRCGGGGDGLLAQAASATLANVTISGNGDENVGTPRAPAYDGYGGGLFVDRSVVRLANVTLAENGAAALSGGNLYLYYDFDTGGADVIAANTISTSPAHGGNCGNNRPSSSTASIEWPLLATGSCGFTTADPQLGPLTANGGPTLTRAIGAGSAARDAGATCEPTDQRGAPRPQGVACDVGAYELAFCRGGIVDVVGTQGNDVLVGTSASEVMLGLGGNDLLHGKAGNDRLCGGDGNDLLSGDAGDDVLAGGSGNDILSPGTGNDQVSGDGDTDTLDYSGAARGVGVDLARGIASGPGIASITTVENVTGTGFRDSLRGDAGPNRLRGDGGSDDLYGGDGNDVLEGGPGNDRLEGQDGNDTLNGGIGDDRMLGGTGRDTLDFTGSTAGVRVTLEHGIAHPTGQGIDDADGVENVTGTSFVDRLRGDSRVNWLRGTGGDDALYGGGHNDVLEGGTGNDWLVGEDGNDALDGGPGIDGVGFYGFGVTVDLAMGAATGQGSDTITAVEDAGGTESRDILRGNAEANLLAGGRGDDDLYGAAGNDILRPGTGKDRIRGDAGIDVLDFTVPFSDDPGAGIEVNLATGAASGPGIDVTVSSVEGVTGSSYRDIVRGNAGANVLDGREGNDDLYGAAGDDVLKGGSGNDVLIGGIGTDTCIQSTGTGPTRSCER